MAGESKIELYLKKRVKESGGHTRKLRFLDANGGPDRLVWWLFPTVALVELKRPGKHVDPQSLQARQIREMVDSGWPVYEINSREAVDKFVAEMAERVLDRLNRVL